jgi:carboxyl-terminal processing protease
VDGVILDLRGNGGGALSEAIDVTGLFIDQGPVVKVKGRQAHEEPYSDREPGAVYAGPLVVLVNKLSASASEILAGAIQDYGRGLVVGDSSTHGKGTVQQVLPVGGRSLAIRQGPTLGAVKLTIQQFYRVNGDSTQNRGVISDIVLPSVIDHMDVGEGDLPRALPFDRVGPLEHPNLGLVSGELKSQLRERSEKRREQSGEFSKVVEDIARWEEFRQRKSITLNEEKRREEKQRTDRAEEAIADPDEAVVRDKSKRKERPTFERNFYNNEVLAIMEDFLQLGQHARVAKGL